MTQVGNVLRLPAELSRLADIRQFIREQATQLGAEGEVIDDIVTAVDELVTNSIVHGYHGAQGEVEVEVEASNGEVLVRLRDQAPAFDPTKVPDPDVTLPLELRPKGGLGIYLSRKATDRLAYRRTDTGNELTLSKQLTSGKGG